MYLSAVLHNLLMFSRHLCSYIVLLLNDWSTPMLNMYCFVTYDCNSPLIMTYCASKNSTSIIESTTLVNVCDLAHFAFLALYPLIWKQRYYFPSGESFWTGIRGSLLYWHWSGSYPNKIFSLGSMSLWLFSLGVSNSYAFSSTEIFVFIVFLCVG